MAEADVIRAWFRENAAKGRRAMSQDARWREMDALRTRLAAAKAREARLVRVLGLAGTLAPQKWADERRAAITTDGAALAQAIEGVLAWSIQRTSPDHPQAWCAACGSPPSRAIDYRHRAACVVAALRREWGQR